MGVLDFPQVLNGLKVDLIGCAGVLNGYKVDRKKKKPEAAENISAGLSVNLTNKLGLDCQHLNNRQWV